MLQKLLPKKLVHMTVEATGELIANEILKKL